MWPIIASIISGISGNLVQSIKDYVNYKSLESKNAQELRLAQLQADKEAAIAQSKSDSDQLRYRLGATSQDFKQKTFWLLCVPVLFSVIFPAKAEVMWYNFSLIPDFIQWLFLSVYSAIWGIPVVKGGYGAVTELLASRREYKINKIKAINEKVFFDEVRKTLFTKGLTQQQVEALQSAIQKGEEGE